MEHLSCTACSLKDHRTQVVPGMGNVDAKIAFVAEAPGKQEDMEGEPLVGAAGKHFDSLLGQAGLRREVVWIDNVVHCRPPKNNLRLYPDARVTCPAMWLMPTLEALPNLRVVVAMGATACGMWFPGQLSVREMDGLQRATQEYTIVGTYHPSASIRTGGSYDRNIVRAMELAKELASG